jgi:hypothetical protein
MGNRLANITCIAILLMCSMFVTATDNHGTLSSYELPPIETSLLEPIGLENVNIWVPADKTGPTINRSCRSRKNCTYACVLPASIYHTKTELCPKEVARLLAEYVACYYERNLPLTILNGWQWEYSYSLSQFESGIYDLSERGGSWENSWEAILTGSIGSAEFQWVQVSSSEDLLLKSDNNEQETNIEVITFDSMRIRDGYPKIRKLE